MRRDKEQDRFWPLAGLSLAGAACWILAPLYVGHRSLTLFLFGWVAQSLAWWFLAIAPMRSRRPHAFLPSPGRVLVLALLLRGLLYPTPPLLDETHTRYLWDGALFATGMNPYRHPPTVWKEAMTSANADRTYKGITHPERPTPHEPLAQYAFRLAARLEMFSFPAWKLIVCLLDLGVLLILYRRHGREGLSEDSFHLWATCPLVLKEAANAGNAEILAAFFVLLAVRMRRLGRLMPAALGLGLAALSSLRTALLIPVLFPKRLAPTLVVLAIVLVGYLPFTTDRTDPLAGFWASVPPATPGESVHELASALAAVVSWTRLGLDARRIELLLVSLAILAISLALVRRLGPDRLRDTLAPTLVVMAFFWPSGGPSLLLPAVPFLGRHEAGFSVIAVGLSFVTLGHLELAPLRSPEALLHPPGLLFLQILLLGIGMLMCRKTWERILTPTE